MQFADTGGDIDIAGIAFDAHRLQRHRTVETADQRVGRRAVDHRGAGGAADIVAGERAGTDIERRRDNRPDHRGAARVADIDAEFRDRADIVIGATAGAFIAAAKFFDEPRI